jgi:hypothetical protein
VAARRLIAVMLVLLFLSSLAAALAPVEQRRDETTSTSTTTTAQPPATEGALVRKTLDAREGRRPRVRASVGDQLQLLVKSSRPATVELAGFGLTEDVDPIAPALFDLLLERPGEFEVRELGGRELGLLEVSRPARTGSDRDRAPARS